MAAGARGQRRQSTDPSRLQAEVVAAHAEAVGHAISTAEEEVEDQPTVGQGSVMVATEPVAGRGRGSCTAQVVAVRDRSKSEAAC